MPLVNARRLAILVCLAAAPASAQDGGRGFFETLKEDVRSAVSKESLSVLSVATSIALLAAPFDETLTYSASCSTFLKTTFGGWARVAGQEWMLGGSALTTYVLGRLSGNGKLAAAGSDLVEAQLIAGATAVAFKHAIRRVRPDGEPRSFPSGHAAGTFAAATVIQRHYGLKGAIPAFAAASLIAGARMQANSHYATDIIAGAAVGILAGRAATFDIGARRVTVSPALTAGGFSVGGRVQ